MKDLGESVRRDLMGAQLDGNSPRAALDGLIARSALRLAMLVEELLDPARSRPRPEVPEELAYGVVTA